MEKHEFYARARGDAPGPLEELSVLEATTTWAGPMCGCVLADLGARVIKVELPAGEVARRVPPFLPGTDPPLSFMHASVNRNKQSVTLDLRQQRGRQLFLELARRADVVVENFRPGTMERWGLGYEQVRGVRADVIYVSITGFGQFGPDHDRPGYDPLAQAESGWLAMNGDPEGMPTKAPTFIGDDVAGLHGATAALAALRHRDRTGEGQHVDVALLDCLLFQSNGYLTLGAMGAQPPRLGNQFQVAAPANVYAARDGPVLVGVLIDSHWQALARVLGRPELAEHPDYATVAARLLRREELDRLVADWVAERSVEEVMRVLAEARLACAPVRSYAEAAGRDHVRERDMLQPTRLEDGTTAPLVGPAAKFSATPTRIRSAPPALGEHSDLVLEEIGLDAAERQRLRDDGVI